VDILAEIVPGLREAIEREQRVREDAFLLDAPEFICGVEVLPFTLEHLTWLIGTKSPFIVGGLVEPGDAEHFLWAVSPDYRRAIKLRNVLGPVIGGFAVRFLRTRFVKSLPVLNAEDLVAAIEAYAHDALMDAPRGTGSGPAYWSVMAGIVGYLAIATGWEERVLMKLPTKRAFQYLKVARKHNNPEAALFNPSDSVTGKWLAEKQAKELEAITKAKAAQSGSKGEGI
jgi:hypothetical protein